MQNKYITQISSQLNGNSSQVNTLMRFIMIKNCNELKALMEVFISQKYKWQSCQSLDVCFNEQQIHNPAL